MVKKEIYHYCSVETLKKIIENRTLRFSDIMKSNDSKEIELLWNEYIEYLKSTNPNALKTEVHCELSEKLKNRVMKTVLFLVLCFSRKKDSLHMWNCYADGGISIGFDYNELLKWGHTVTSTREDGENECITFGRMKYFKPAEIQSFIKGECEKVNGRKEELVEMFLNAPFCKSDFFKAEEEVRALIEIWTDEKGSSKIGYTVKNKKREISLGIYSNNYSAIVPYVDVPFPEEMIKSITIGPNCLLTEKDITQLLFVNEFKNCQKIKVEKSSGTYRKKVVNV